MGNYSITIEGVGSHDNGKSYDAEQMATDLVEKLRAAGHTITHTSFVCGTNRALSHEPLPHRQHVGPVLEG